MDISHLVVNGCSFTYCQGLDDPKTQGWPALVANYLNCDVVNLAIRGTGNDCIHRRTYEYIIENSSTNSKPFVIVAWSQYWRREGWFKSWYYANCNDYNFIQKPDNKPRNGYETALLDNYDEEDFLRKTMLYKISLVSLLQSYNIPYIMTDYMEESFLPETIEKVKFKFSNFYNLFSNLNDFPNLRETTLNTPLTECKHTGYEGQQKIRTKMIEEINKKYDNINVVKSNFLSLKEFSKVKNDCWNHKSCWE